MVNHEKQIHRSMLIGWSLIAVVLFVSYLGEVLKQERSLTYFIGFMSITLLPLFFCIWLHVTGKLQKHFSIIIVCSYFAMYAFVMLTGSTTMVFSYILPLLSFMVLFHHSSLVLWTGLASLVVNVISIISRFEAGKITVENSKDVEIQLALIVLCFIGAWVSSRMYDRITCDNEAYMQQMIKQAEEIANQKHQLVAMENEVEVIAEKANTDVLTGIGNRFGFESYLETIKDCKTIGVIFCDANGLKYCNDHEGHEAGDQLLVALTRTLTRYFHQDECFRMGGDEFITILPDVEEAVLNQRAQWFRNHVWAKEPPIASIGWAYGSNVTEALKNAEAKMYLDKNKFYAKYPQYKR